MLHQRQPLEVVVDFGRLGQILMRLALEDAEDALFLLGPGLGRNLKSVKSIAKARYTAAIPRAARREMPSVCTAYR